MAAGSGLGVAGLAGGGLSELELPGLGIAAPGPGGDGFEFTP